MAGRNTPMANNAPKEPIPTNKHLIDARTRARRKQASETISTKKSFRDIPRTSALLTKTHEII